MSSTPRHSSSTSPQPPQPVASSGGDNDKREENVGEAPYVGVDEGESRHSRDDSLVEYVGIIKGKLRKGILISLPNNMLMRITGGKHQPSSFIMSDPSSSSFKI